MTQVGEIDENGFIAYVDADYDEHTEWLEKQHDIRPFHELKIIYSLLERGATPNQSLKALEEIKNKSIDEKDCFNNVVKENLKSE
tara:strand:+ start:67 stop:321 length:255 start_codon:yes stop_codon:yes gene_type:complete